MDFSLSEEQEAVRDLARQILSDNVSHERLTALAKSGEWFDLSLWKTVAEANLPGVALPESCGGSGLGWLELCLVLAELGRHQKVCAVFYGSPAFLTRSAHEAVRAARGAGFPAAMLPGVSSLECMAADLGIDFGEVGCQVYEANAFLSRARSVDTGAYLILCQVAMIGQPASFDGDAERVGRGLARLARRLEASYPASHPVLLYEAGRHPLLSAKADTLALSELPLASVTEVATLCVPPVDANGVSPILEHPRVLGNATHPTRLE